MRTPAIQNSTSNLVLLSGLPEDAELQALSSEDDPQLLREALLDYAQRQEEAGKLELASGIYQRLREEGGGAWAARAGVRVDAMLGRGAVGPRAEFLLRRLVGEAADPANLAAMGLASSVFRVTRLATLGRLTGSPVSNLFTRGFGARAIASLTGFALEAPAFTLAARFSRQALGGEVSWHADSLGRDLASSYLVLGAMKSSGWLGSTLYRRSGAASGISRNLFAQGSLLGGLMLGHRLETLTGIRPAVSGETTLVDSLAMLVQFNIAGRLGRQFFGPEFSNSEDRLDRQNLALSEIRTPGFFNIRKVSMFSPVLEMASIKEGGALPPVASTVETTFPRSSSPAYESYNYPPGGKGTRPPFLRYSPEARKLWPSVEVDLRAVPFQAEPEEILRRRADVETVDRLWLFQIQDFVELTKGRVEIHSPERLREPWTSQYLRPKEDLLSRALDLAGGKGKVYEISLPYGDAQFGRPNEQGSYSGLRHVMEDLENSFGNQVLLANVREGRIQVRLPNLPLWEALLRARFGDHAHRLALVDGLISRDQVMTLRGKLLAPVGITRQATHISELNGRVHAFFFTLHDLFHATTVGLLPPELSQTAHRLYFLAKSELPASRIKEEHLNRLADMDPGSDFRNNPAVFVDFSLRPFWDGFKKDVMEGVPTWNQIRRYPQFLSSYERMLRVHPPEAGEDPRWHEAFRSRIQDHQREFSKLLRSVLQN